MKELNLIVACDKNGVIGKENHIPWINPHDMKYFRDTTMGHTVIMGNKTYNSLPRVLKGRENIVISRRREVYEINSNIAIKRVYSLEEALEKATRTPFIIGGEQIYKLAMPLVTTIYMTILNIEVKEGDAFFKFPADEFDLVESRFVEECNFQRLVRSKPCSS